MLYHSANVGLWALYIYTVTERSSEHYFFHDHTFENSAPAPVEHAQMTTHAEKFSAEWQHDMDPLFLLISIEFWCTEWATYCEIYSGKLNCFNYTLIDRLPELPWCY